MDPRPAQPTTALEQVWNDHYDYLVEVAHRLLRDRAASEDMAQDAFGQLMGTDVDDVRDLRAWLTVVVRRLSLNRLQSAYARREAVSGSLPLGRNDARSTGDPAGDPADRLTLDDQVQMALALILDRLTPAERTAFLLHDVFGFSYDVIGQIVGRNATACRQLASRARRTVRARSADDDADSAQPTGPQLTGQLAEQHSLVVERFIAAASGGNLTELLAILDPAVTGEATLLDQGIVLQVEGAERAAARIVDLFGPRSGSELLPIPLDGIPGIVATARHRVAVIQVDTRSGAIHHLRAFVAHQQPGQLSST